MKQLTIILFFVLAFFKQLSAQSPIQKFWALNQSTAKYLLNKLPATSASVAYSVRKLNKSYTGPAMNVRRNAGFFSSSVNADVAFNASDVVDGTSMVTITAAGFFSGYSVGDVISFATFYSGTSVYIATWYDQSGNNRHVTQSTTSQQPRIVNSGTLETSNSIASIRFLQSSSTVLEATIAASTMFTSGYIGTLSSVIEASSGNTSAFGYGNGSNRWQAHMDEAGFIRFDVGNTYNRLSSPSNTAHEGILRNYLLIAGGSPSMQIFRSGTSIATATPSLSACTRSDFNVGGIPGFPGSWYQNDHMSELIIFPTALSASEIMIVQTDQSTYYSTP